jgi:undecaprenyl-diphosphatase
MELFQIVQQLDEGLFFLINSVPHPQILDQIFLFFSFYPLIIWMLVGLIMIVVEERQDKLFILRLFLALLLSGLLASGVIKPIIKRPRPDITFGQQVILVEEKPAAIPTNNDFAFPSGHAAVAFAGAYVVTREETTRSSNKHSRKKKQLIKLLLLFFAIMTAFSRIYLGKHYPLDAIAGGVLGWYMGWAAWKMIDLVKPSPTLKSNT